MGKQATPGLHRQTKPRRQTRAHPAQRPSRQARNQEKQADVRSRGNGDLWAKTGQPARGQGGFYGSGNVPLDQGLGTCMTLDT